VHDFSGKTLELNVCKEIRDTLDKVPFKPSKRGRMKRLFEKEKDKKERKKYVLRKTLGSLKEYDVWKEEQAAKKLKK
jgi:hypothetical protein